MHEITEHQSKYYREVACYKLWSDGGMKVINYLVSHLSRLIERPHAEEDKRQGDQIEGDEHVPFLWAGSAGVIPFSIL